MKEGPENPSQAVRWHSLTAAAVLEAVGSSPQGLSTEQVEERLRRCGPNELRVPSTVSAWKILLRQFRSVVVLLLVVATVAAWLLGDSVEAMAVLGVLIVNATIGFVTELRARTAMAALLRLEVPKAVVVRHGHRSEIASAALVPGDLIILEAGQAIPADARLLTASELRTNEAALTGESMPVDKQAAMVIASDTPLAERANMLYMATAVATGAARAVVTATGMQTEVGRIGGLVGGIREERTPLEHRLDALGRRLVWGTLAVAGLVVAIGLLRDEPLDQIVATGIALAIAAVPEGLPAVSTIALAIGVARMARRNALVRRLPAVEALGSATTVCTDKTGTLTAGEMTVTSIWTADAEYSVTGVGYESSGSIMDGAVDADVVPGSPLELILRIGALTNRASLAHTGSGWEIRGDPTEAALLVAAHKAGLERADMLQRWPETGQIPFSSERMLMATFHGREAFIKGSPSHILEKSNRLLTRSGVVALDPEVRQRVIDENSRLAGRGLRVLGFASGSAAPITEHGVCELTFVGLVGMSDPPAAGVRETITRFHQAGIRTVMLTGDQRLTAESVAGELGMLRPGDEVIDGRDIEHMEPQQLGDRLRRASALSRVSPEDKLRIVDALQHRGEIVAMLGDGVNDAAALKKANIGVAMGMRGTDVAREAASVVLQDDRFQTIAAAVEEGRVIFDNIRKFVFYLFSCNVAEVLVILVAGVAGMPQPLLPLQILWLNLITDTFPALSLAAEPAESDVMQRPPRDPRKAILSAGFVASIGFYALLITAATLGSFMWALSHGGDTARAVTVAFMTLALAQTFHLGNARGGSVVTWRRMSANLWALGAVALTIALQFVAVYFPPLASVLDLMPLRAQDWAVIMAAAIMPAVIGQLIAVRRSRMSPRRDQQDVALVA
jgi:Ca2+-transporting ATPase